MYIGSFVKSTIVKETSPPHFLGGHFAIANQESQLSPKASDKAFRTYTYQKKIKAILKENQNTCEPRWLLVF